VLYDGMSGKEYLRLMAGFHQKSDIRLKELQERLTLDLKKQTRAYSKGMKQKLVIIQAFMHDPDLLILDEPTLGLDPLMQREFYELLLEEKNRGKTILLSSHILTEVERVCDRVGIVRNGELVAIEAVSALKHKKVHHVQIALSHELPLEAIRLEGVEILSLNGRELEVRVSGNIQQLLHGLCQLPVEDLSFHEASLEDTFMKFYDKEQP
jgi:ABC-2 type transport system ATP-binding protein